MTKLSEDLLTTEQFAQEIGRNPATLVRWRRERRRGAPPWIYVCGRVYYSRRQLDQWLQDHTCKAVGS